ncbi:beta-galactosidase family protein [Streptomyces sp. AK04-3B]|uniref:glycoside hydrolase family 35 protein n=1 Tax=Streptomyces sp. AK04-3B TaxID=3028650 RepID=UPI0029A442D6|nr:beta-galactosidase family protein [Streptomyces sp. AK04-3B]MDX3804629.1 beta-galactosidase [Streptomyces sp. AK04-3B]
MPALATTSDGFLLHGDPFRILSGAMHYFRVHPDQWADRLRKARLMGLNTVETYLPWNLHQPEPGTLVLDGLLDLPRFLRLAAAEGLHVLLRPGPFICAEWDGGGLPHWLTTDPDIRLRTSDPRFTDAVDRYLDLLLPPLLPHMAASGGPVIAVQVENEYGAYGDDVAYLKHIEHALRSRGVEELLFTCDQTAGDHLRNGTLPGVLATGTFGSRVEESLRRLREAQPEGPLMCSEFWIGWFDHWGGPHHGRDAGDAAADLDRLLSAGASVNIYMFHGGTNFGYTNGANHHHAYVPTVTSYDYDAPLTESGDPGPKYHAFREVIARHAPVPDEPVPDPSPKLPPTTVRLTHRSPLIPPAGRPVRATDPLSADELGRRSGYMLYRTTVPTPGDGLLHFAGGVGDRAQVFLDGAPAGVLERERYEETLPVHVPRAGAVLDVLVENMGRVNYGPRIGVPKGLLGPVTFLGRPLQDWDCHALPLDDAPSMTTLTAAHPTAPHPTSVAATSGTADAGTADAGTADAESATPGPLTSRIPVPEAFASAGPAFHHGAFDVSSPADAFLSLPGWTKGQAWINGFHLGRYWNRGPQRTLYVPGPILRRGVNDLVLLELHGATTSEAHLTDVPDLGPTGP